MPIECSKLEGGECEEKRIRRKPMKFKGGNVMRMNLLRRSDRAGGGIPEILYRVKETLNQSSTAGQRVFCPHAAG